MTLFRVVAWGLFLLFVLGPPSRAQSPSDSTAPTDSLWQLDLAPVVVTATRAERRAEEVGVPVSVIGRQEIESQGAARMTDLLANQPGLTINTDHGSGLQMRGLGPEYTLILVDGKPIVGRTAGTLDLDRLTTANVERVEIVRGPTSSLYGSDALAGVVASGEGVLPHPNVERWLRRTATTYRPLSPDDVGVIAVPHGSEYNWNQTMREGLAPLTDDYRIAEAFSMVDPPVIERAVRDLEDEGYKAAVMVRIFSMESNFQEKAHYILGLQDTFGTSIMGVDFPPRIRTHLQMTTLGGLEASPHFAKGLLDRAQAISENPSDETVILLAHGTGSDAKNARWMDNLRTMADTMRAHGGDAFRDIKVHTWREDWPEKRKQTIPEIQQMVREASENGTALVIPARTTSRGRASQYLEGLDYRYGKGFAPHAQFERWMREQIETGIDRLQAAPQTPAPVTTTAGEAQ